MRADRISALGYWKPLTAAATGGGAPTEDERFAIDGLIELGVLFVHAYTPSISTDAALASVHHGRSPLELCVAAQGDGPATSVQPLAESFAGAGFRTLARVSRSGTPSPEGWSRGFADFTTCADDQAAVDALGSELERWREHGAEPFFAWLHIEDPRRAADESAGDDEAYDEAVARTNARLQALCAGLSRSGTFDDCMLALLGLGGARLERDELVGSPSRGTPTERQLRVPFLLRHTASLTGRRIFADIVSLADLAPTVREWFGLESEPRTTPGRGRSLLSITDEWRRRAFPREPALFVGGDLERPCLGWRDERWRAAWWPRGHPESGEEAERWQLFDLVTDPRATSDLAAVQPRRIEELRGEIIAYLRRLELTCGMELLRELR